MPSWPRRSASSSAFIACLGRSVQVEAVGTAVVEWFSGAMLLLDLADVASLAWFGHV
jgi:hypothetical protein